MKRKKKRPKMKEGEKESYVIETEKKEEDSFSLSHFLTIHNNGIEKENRECSESQDSAPTHETENGHERWKKREKQKLMEPRKESKETEETRTSFLGWKRQRIQRQRVTEGGTNGDSMDV